jgi:phosphate transport system permease protein
MVEAASAAPVVWLLTLAILLAAAAAFANGRLQALALARAASRPMHSLPEYHGWHAALLTAGPALVTVLVFAALGERVAVSFLEPDLPAAVQALPKERYDLFLIDAVKIARGELPSETSPAHEAAAAAFASIDAWMRAGLALCVAGLAGGGFLLARGRIRPEFRARTAVETAVMVAMIGSAAIAVLTTAGIVLSLLFETLRFFGTVSPVDFLFGLHWSPQIAIRADQVGSSGAFGAVPLFVGTFLIMVIAMAVAAPIGLGSAIYLSEYASPSTRRWVKPILEILAGVPTVVYGVFALLTVAPAVREVGRWVGLDVPAQSALAAGLVMGIMIIPFISSLSDDVINAVPQTLRDGSYAMGATKSETIRNVVFPAALPGIIGSLLLAVSRALGETMIVTMAAGQAANLSINPLETVTTVTVQIVMLLTGDQEFDSPKTMSAFALGFVLFVVTLVLNIIALRVVQKYREKYD